MNIPQKDIEILRQLADRVVKHAAAPVMEERRRLWRKLHSLKMERPMLYVETSGVLDETTPLSSLLCESEMSRKYERLLRDKIFYAQEILDDYVIEPHIFYNKIIKDTGFGIEMQKTTTEAGKDGISSVHYDAAITDLEEDLKRLHLPQYSIDQDATDEQSEFLHTVFDGVINLEYSGSYWWSDQLSSEAVRLLGLENFMFAMYDEPENLHRLIEFLRDKKIHMYKWHEQNGLLRPNNKDHYVSSGGIGYCDELGKDHKSGTPGTLKDMWGLVESQETVCVSPDMFKEFVFDYQKPIAELFGLSCYGCCEPVNNRWHLIKQIENLRTVSVSPWADEEVMSSGIKGDYLYSRKVNPSNVSMEVWDAQLIRDEIRKTLTLTKEHGCNVEIILKDVHTVKRIPKRLNDWVVIAREEIDKIYG